MDALYRTQHDKKSLNWPIQELGHVIFHEFFKFPMDVCPKSSGGKHPTHLSGNHIYPLKNVLKIHCYFGSWILLKFVIFTQ